MSRFPPIDPPLRPVPPAPPRIRYGCTRHSHEFVQHLGPQDFSCTPPVPGCAACEAEAAPIAQTNASIIGLQKKLERVRGVLANQLKRDHDARWEALDILNDKE